MSSSVGKWKENLYGPVKNLHTNLDTTYLFKPGARDFESGLVWNITLTKN